LHPQDEAHAIIKRRFPTPRFTDCDQNGSQARFLLAKLNPSATYNTSSAMSSEIIMTDDVSLQVRGGACVGSTIVWRSAGVCDGAILHLWRARMNAGSS